VSASRLEARLAAQSRRSACVLTGNATTAIYLALRIVHERSGGGEVIVSTITCPSVVQAIVYAGFVPVFADVDVPECTLDPASLRGLINARTRAIIAIHIFGHAAPLAAILAAAGDIPVIEDAAPATGGASDGRPFGSFGAFSVHSFGGTKIVTAGGGGAFLTDDLDAARRARELLGGLAPLAADAHEQLLELSQRNMTHGLMDLLRVEPDAAVGSAFLAVLPRYERLWLHALAPHSPLLARIGAGLDGLEANLAARRAVAMQYHEGLADLAPRVQRCTGWLASGVVWRYTFLIDDPEATLAATGALRAAGLNASNHYWSVAQLMFDQQLPASTYVSRRLVNLWVDRTTSAAAIEATLAVLHEALSS
jgi:dTDP-4-amino-4,6-dideoxygalactose transaminase